MSHLIDLNQPLYHGSYIEICSPDTSFSRRATDFGTGFYLGDNREQADEIAIDRGDLKQHDYGVTSQFSYQQTNAVIRFDFELPNINWLEFVLYNRDTRTREYIDQEYCSKLLTHNDIITGPIADDDLSPTINDLIINLQNIDPDNSERIQRIKLDTISDLRPYRYKYQACFKTQEALDNLIFVRSRNVVK